jgi:parallel beta-helix repeat protein
MAWESAFYASARGRMAAAAGAIATVAVAALTASSPAAMSCDRVTAPSGSDSAAGTVASPYRTTQRLADSLAPGQTGCLRAGLYEQDVKVTKGGAAGSPVTISSYPGERATLKGRLRIADSANFVTVESLDLDGRDASGLPSPSVYGDDVVFRDNDVTDHHTGICFLLGSSSYGRAKRTTIERNRIHDCGVLPALNHHHGIYIEASDDARILSNWIYDNADRGVQMFPDSQGSYISGNVIDGNGQGVSFARQSANNVVERNVVSNSVLRWNIEDWELSGTGNVARDNCVWTTRTDLYNRQGGIMVNPDFTSAGNLIADPLFVDRGAKDFRLRDGSPCAALLAAGGTPPPVQPAPAPSPVPAPAPEPAPGVDSPPKVKVKSPRQGTRFTRRLTIVADAVDDGGVARVDLYVDSRLVDRDTSDPYSETWAVPRRLSYGSHSVTAKAYDGTGQSEAHSIGVTRVKSTKAGVKSKRSKRGKRRAKRR